MKLKLKEGTTSKIVTVFVQDSSSTVGAGLAGLVFNTASLTGYWIAEGDATATAITLATMTAGTWATGGFVEVDATNLPGVYQVGLPDVVVDATSEGSVVVMLKGAANMAPVLMEIELDAIDYKDSVRGGMTALPAAVPGANGGVFIAGTNAATTITTGLTTTFTGNLTGSVGSVTGAVGSVTGAVGSVTGAVGSVTGAVGSVAGNVDGSVATLTTLTAIPANWLTAAGIAASALDGKGDWNTVVPPSVAQFNARTRLDADYFSWATDAVATVTTVGTTTTNTDMITFANIWTAAMTESYSVDGAAPTPAQSLFLIQQALTDVGIVSTTETIRKLDGSTAAATLTLDSASAPTSKTRAT